MTTEPLLDNEFLEKLFSHRYRETYARITSLNIDEEPLEMVEGRITQGSVNLDGSSSLRRTCSLSLVCNLSTALNDYYWTTNTKFKLMIGLKNEVDSKYPDIIWFKLGTYVITSFSYSYSTAGMSISISGKDKMCLINGDVGGAIYASVDFGTREEIDEDGNKELVDINIEDIIREAVHEYGHEPWERIIIQDIPKYGLFLLEWMGDTPIYALIPADGRDEATQAFINGEVEVYVDGVATPISELECYLTTNNLTEVDKRRYTLITLGDSDKEYYVCRILSGQSAGYDVTELTYPRNGEESGLITSIGDSVTSVLDKIVDFLGNYEYFFDVDGNFIFQKKDKWIDTNWNANDFNAVGMGNDYTLLSYLPTTWLFEGNDLVVSFNNSPNIGNIKNDYAIWGERQSGDTAIPIHMRQAVDKKPVYYKSISATKEEIEAFIKLYPEFKNGFKGMTSDGWPSKIYYTKDYDGEIPVGIEAYEEDWRELIYQMALDYRRFNHFDTFNARILQNNTIPDGNGNYNVLYPKGITGYEQYYVDLEGFWRYLYRPEYDTDKVLGYSIKGPEELDLDENIQIRDHWYNYLDKPTQGEYKEYYVTSIHNETLDINEPYLIENPKQLSPELFTKNLMCWEYGWAEDAWGDDRRFYYTLHSPDGIGSAWGFYYDNGSGSDIKYDKNGYIISNNDVPYPIKEYRTDKYNLILNYREDVTYEELQNVQQKTLPDSEIDFEKFNSFTVYKVNHNNQDEYQMLERYASQQITYYKPPRRILTPTFEGLKWANNGKFIYKGFYVDNSYKYIHSKVGILQCLPSTFTYSNFTTTPSVDDNIKGQRWQEFKDKPFFNFSSSGSFENSALFLDENNNKYTDLEEQDNYVKNLMKYGTDDYYKYYKYINYDKKGDPILDDNNDYTFKSSPIAQYQEAQTYTSGDTYDTNNHWNILKDESPELLLFWFDFLDSQTSEIGKYGVNNVMDRSKASNESNVKAIYYRDTLNIVYERISKSDDEVYQKLLNYTRSGYNIIQAGDWVWDQFKVSNCGKSCKDVLDQWLYQYTQANESVSISCIPIYTLEPNNRISIHDDNIKIDGEYVINSISIPLTFNGTMNINAIKAVDKLQ